MHTVQIFILRSSIHPFGWEHSYVLSKRISFNLFSIFPFGCLLKIMKRGNVFHQTLHRQIQLHFYCCLQNSARILFSFFVVNGWLQLWLKKYRCFVHIHEHGIQNSFVTTIHRELLSYAFGKFLTNQNQMATKFLASFGCRSAAQLLPCKKWMHRMRKLLISSFFKIWLDEQRLCS